MSNFTEAQLANLRALDEWRRSNFTDAQVGRLRWLDDWRMRELRRTLRYVCRQADQIYRRLEVAEVRHSRALARGIPTYMWRNDRSILSALLCVYEKAIRDTCWKLWDLLGGGDGQMVQAEIIEWARA